MQEAIRAAYRQVFERDVGHAYELAVAELESQVRSGQFVDERVSSGSWANRGYTGESSTNRSPSVG